VVKYTDENGDEITIFSNKDIEVLFGHKSSDFVRAKIEEQAEDGGESNLGEEQKEMEDSGGDLRSDEDEEEQEEEYDEQEEDWDGVDDRKTQ